MHHITSEHGHIMLLARMRALIRNVNSVDPKPLYLGQLGPMWTHSSRDVPVDPTVSTPVVPGATPIRHLADQLDVTPVARRDFIDRDSLLCFHSIT